MTTTTVALEAWHDVAARLRVVESLVTLGGISARALRRAAELCEVRAVAEGMALRTLPSPRVCIESPLKGDVARNASYADACLFDSLSRGEAPFLGHLLYPRVLSDDSPEDRNRGITAHCAWLQAAHCVAVYVDLGVTSGMRQAMTLAAELGIPVTERALGYGWRRVLEHVRPTGGFERVGICGGGE